MDTEACHVATSTKDALGAPPSVRPTANMATYMDGGSSCASSAYDVEDTTGHAAPATGAPDAPSSACSPMDVAIDCASLVDAVATPAPLMLATSVVLAGS